MIAAVLAMLASRQVAAVTLAVRHGLATGRPVAGSSRWCADPPSVSHRRTVVLEVARPPVRSVIHCPGAVASERWSSVTRIRQPSSGGCPAIEMSPPSETSTPHSALALAAAAAWSAASALAVALVLLTVSVVLGILDSLRFSAGRWPRFAIDSLHRDTSLLVIALLVVHVVTSVLDGFAPIKLTDAIIPFAGARFAQQTTIRLEAGAGLFWWEILAPGREASGETFRYENVDLKLDLSVTGKLVAAERLRLEPAKREMSSVARMGAYSTWATFYICREGIDGSVWNALESELRALVESFGDTETLWGVSTLAAHGLAIRCLMRNARVLVPRLHEIWSAAKNRLYGRPAVPPRKVN